MNGKPYYMLNTREHALRRLIINLIGNAVCEGNESHTPEELGTIAVDKLEQEGYEIIFLKGSRE